MLLIATYIHTYVVINSVIAIMILMMPVARAHQKCTEDDDYWTSYTFSELHDVRRNCPVACEQCESTCPWTCQAAVNDIYSTCDCQPDWSTLKPEWKANVEAIGCGGVRAVACSVLPLLAQAAIHTLAM